MDIGGCCVTRRVLPLLGWVLFNGLLVAQVFPVPIAGGVAKATYIGADAPAVTTALMPALVAPAPNGDIYIADQDGTLLKLNPAGRLSYVAANLPVGTSGFFQPIGGMAADRAGNVYLADSANHTVLRIAPSGAVLQIAGTHGKPGFSGDGGPAASAQFNWPRDVKIDGAGNVYIADSFNYRIRKITPAGVISTVAGNGDSGLVRIGAAAPDTPLGGGIIRFTLDNKGTIYYWAGAAGVVRIDENGIVRPYVQTGTLVLRVIAVDSRGQIHALTDTNTANYSVSRLPASAPPVRVVGTGVAGFSGDGGAATSAQINNPSDIVFDASDNLLIADTVNRRLRRVDPSNVIRTMAGNGSANYNGDGLAATTAALSRPQSIGLDSQGNLYIGDSGNLKIRKVDPQGRISTFMDGVIPTTTLAAGAPINIAVQPNGTVYFFCRSSSGSAGICRAAADGRSSTMVVGGGTVAVPGANNIPANTAQLTAFRGFVVDGAGNLYLDTTQFVGQAPAIYKVDSRNTLTVVDRPPSSLTAMTINPAGNLVTASFDSVATYGADGKLISRRALPSGYYFGGIAEDAEGSIYLSGSCGIGLLDCPPSTGLFKFTKDGQLFPYADPASVQNPFGLLIDRNRILIADRDRDAVLAAPLTSTPVVVSTNIRNGASVRSGPVAPDEFVRILGLNLALKASPVSDDPVDKIEDTKVTVRDGNGSRAALGLFSVSPNLILGVMPPGMAPGRGSLLIENSFGSSPEIPMTVAAAAPGLHAVNGSGSGPAFANLETTNADGVAATIPVYSCSAPGNCVTAGLYPAEDSSPVLSFFATGVRHASESSFTLGAENAEILSIRPDEKQAGFDVVRVRVPPSLAEAGDVDAVITADGVKSNPVEVTFGNPVAFELRILPAGGTNKDNVTFSLINRSAKAEITRFSFTIGDTSRNFDVITGPLGSPVATSPGVQASIVKPDQLQGAVRTDAVEVRLTGMLPGNRWQANSEIDSDDADTVEDFTKVFFNNGDLPNSEIRVEFNDGRVLTMTVPDELTANNLYTFTRSAPTSNAAGYELTIGPGGSGADTPRLILTNRSERVEIARFELSIGNTSFNFDIGTLVASQTSAGVQFTLVSPDGANGGRRSDTLDATFTGLSPGRVVSIATDIDSDLGDSVESFFGIFFNNGDAPNSTARVTFSDGRVLTMTLPDGVAVQNLFVFQQSTP